MNQRQSSQQERVSDLLPEVSEDQRYGYVIHGMDKVDRKGLCIMCERIIKEPVQLTECGHRACRGCCEVQSSKTPEGNVTCKECQLTTAKAEIMIDRAFKKELDILPVACMHTGPDCDWKGQLHAYQEHLDKMHMGHHCPNCNEQFLSINLRDKHMKTVCPSLFEACPLHVDGCQEKISKKEPQPHLLSEPHQQAIVAALIRARDGRASAQSDQSMEITAAASSTSVSTIENNIENQTREALSDLAEKVGKLNDETIELSNNSVRVQENLKMTVQEINKLNSSISEQRIGMSDLQPKQVNVQKEIELMKQVLEENHHISTDGTLTWRVDRVAERMADAQSERQTSIYSPMFYSSPSGYKMRARLYLHGDGNARRTHMSLFFLLMRGDYDPLLKWPFHYKVTFCLFDQTGANRHIIDSFRPDVKSNSFQRPKTDANIASGIPKFFPLPMIQQDDNPYVRDDTLFLKIVVDLNDTPKIMLPFILTLNPGLPYQVQQNLIKLETARRQQQPTTAGAAAPTTPPVATNA